MTLDLNLRICASFDGILCQISFMTGLQSLPHLYENGSIYWHTKQGPVNQEAAVTSILMTYVLYNNYISMFVYFLKIKNLTGSINLVRDLAWLLMQDS